MLRRGLQFKLGKLLNPELAVQETRVISKEARDEFSALIKKWRPLVRATLRMMTPIELDVAVLSRYKFGRITVEDAITFLKVDPEEIPDDAHSIAVKLIELGAAYTTIGYRREITKELANRFVVNLFQKTREAYYRINGAYTFKQLT